MAAGRIKGITIEIGANTTKLTSALAKVDSALSKTQTNLRDLNKALKLDPGNTNLLKDRQQELAKAIEETDSKLKTEKKAYEELSKADKTPDNVEKMRQLKVQIDLDTVALKELKEEAKAAASVLGSQMQAAGDKIKEVGDKIKGVGDKITGLGQTLTQKVTVPIVAAFGAAIKTTADFDAQMSKVQAISGATGEEFGVLRDKAREMGEATKYSATEVGQGFEYMGMAGWKAEQMVEGIPAILNLAAAAGEELGTTSDIVTDALTAFGLAAEDAGRFADILAAASTNSNTNVSMLGESFKYAAAPAGALGYTVEDVAIALGLMANAGIKADMAGTSLRNMFQRMAKPTKESAEAMERLGLELYDGEGKMFTFREIMDQLRKSFTQINMPLSEYDAQLEALNSDLEAGTLTQKKYDAALEELNLRAFGAEGAEKARAAAMLGGARAMSGLLAIANATEADYKKLTDAIDNSSASFAKLADGSVIPLNEALASGAEIMETYEGQAAAMAAVMQDNLTGDVTVLKSKLQELAISFGDLLMPTIRQAVELIQGLVDKLNSLDEGQKQQIIKIAAIVAAIGPALIIIGNLISAISVIVNVIGSVVGGLGTLMTFIAGLGAPILIIIGLIGALVAAFVYFYNTNEEFREKVNAVIEAVKVAFQGFVENVKAWIDEVIAWFAPIVQVVGEYLTALWELVTTIVQNIVSNVKEKLDAHSTEINAVISTIKMLVESALVFIHGVITTKLNIIKSIFTGVLSILTNLIKAFTAILKGDWKSAMDYLKQAAQSAVDMVKNIFNNLKDGLKSIFSGLIANFKSWGSDMMDGLISGISEKIEAVKTVASNVAGAIKEFLHFSEPDVGPLSDFHTYAPDMMALFAQGIRDNAHLITDAIGSSFDLRPYFNSMTTGIRNLNNIGANLANNTANTPIVLQVSLEGDAQRMFRVLSEEAHRDWQITGQSRLMGY